MIPLCVDSIEKSFDALKQFLANQETLIDNLWPEYDRAKAAISAHEASLINSVSSS